MDELQMRLRVLTRYLNDNELFYVFTGELALRMHGCAEEVGTVDLLANLTPQERERLLNFLEHEGYAARSRWRSPISMGHTAGGIGLRLRLAGSGAEMATLGRRVSATLGYVSFFIPSYEDLILNLVQEGGTPESELVRIYSKFRNYLDMEYLVLGAREMGIYPQFVKMKIRAEK